MNVVHEPTELERQPRAIAIGSFDGFHRGHQRVLDEAFETGLPVLALTFDPHPRTALGNRVELLTTLERRLELLAEYGVEEALVVRFDLDVAKLEPKEFIARYLEPLGSEVIVAGPDFRFGHGRAGDLKLLLDEGFAVKAVRQLPGVSSSSIRQLLHEGEVEQAAELLGRPPEVDGLVVSGDARGGTLGYPTANVAAPPDLLVPRNGIYAGSAGGHRAAISIGTNPHYGGVERRVEAFLLDYQGDLYGQRLVVELWKYLRDEQVFESEAALIDQIGRDVVEARAASRPA